MKPPVLTPVRGWPPLLDAHDDILRAASPLSIGERELIAAPDAAQRDRLKADVVRVAIERTPGSNGWNQVRTLVTQSLDPAAFVVETHSFDALGKNVVGTKQGTGREKEIVILSAHYDHIAGCKGADDNASGVAVVMEAARVLSKRTFVRTLVLAFWDREEDGLLGSRAWATRAKSQGVDIRTMISLDGVGFANRRPGSQTLPPGAGELLPAVAKRLAANDGRADFIAVLSLAWPDGSSREFEGKVFGSLVWPPRGTRGFGYDPMFLPDGQRLLFSDVSNRDASDSRLMVQSLDQGDARLVVASATDDAAAELAGEVVTVMRAAGVPTTLA